ncbi:MAG: hypothetical protein QW685_10110 [Saccharolobus sp.]
MKKGEKIAFKPKAPKYISSASIVNAVMILVKLLFLIYVVTTFIILNYNVIAKINLLKIIFKFMTRSG